MINRIGVAVFIDSKSKHEMYTSLIGNYNQNLEVIVFDDIQRGAKFIEDVIGTY